MTNIIYKLNTTTFLKIVGWFYQVNDSILIRLQVIEIDSKVLKKSLNFLKKSLNFLKKTLRLRVFKRCEIHVSQNICLDLAGPVLWDRTEVWLTVKPVVKDFDSK